MISEYQIRQLNEYPLQKLFEESGYTVQRATGGNFIVSCPFHNEKTPSCHIYSKANKYHCFGCGEHGDPISFVRKTMNMSFMEACRYLADKQGLQLDDKPETDEQKEARTAKAAQREINYAARMWFVEQLAKSEMAQEYVYGRWNKATVEQFGIGYAPDNFNELYKHLREKGFRSDDLVKSKLFNENKGKIYSVFRDRVMFPICNANGEVCGFSGRFIVEKDDHRKYVNTADCDVYKKGELLFGLDMAWKAITKQDCAILVEGNPDVVHMHQIGVENVVAACGTALTTEQIKILARATKNIVLLYDSDDAGQNATNKNGKRITAEGLNAYTLTIPPDSDGGKQDPDTFFTDKKQFALFIDKNRISFLEYLAKEKAPAVKGDVSATTKAVKEILNLIADRPESELSAHIQQLAKILPDKRLWNTALKEVQTEKKAEATRNGYSDRDLKMIDVYGFYEKNNSYRMQSTPEGGYKEVSNFVLEPLFHIESTINAKRLYQLKNNRGVTRGLEIAQKDLVSLSAFRTKVESFGNFLFLGSETDLGKIKAYLYENTKSCIEVEQLGWQREGFWVWSNGIVSADGRFHPIDEYGCVEHNGQWYYIPALSRFFASDTTLFQFERKFIYKAGATADLNTLAEKMLTVYGNNSVVGICFYLATLFRDIVFRKNGCFPILNIFGEKNTGKTQMAVTLLQLFGDMERGINGETATIPAMGDHISHCRNALCHIDEYKNNWDPVKIEMMKSVYDGVGRSRMNMDKDKKKETLPVDCGVILTGQEMTTMDDALFSRVLYLTATQTVRTEAQIAAFDDLKEYEKKGLSCITNRLLSLRNVVEENFDDCLQQTKNDIAQAIDVSRTNVRLVQNWTSVLAVFRSLEEHLTLPYNYYNVLGVFVDKIKAQNASVKDISDTAEFWSAVEFLLVNGEIQTGYDIKLIFNKPNITIGNMTYSQPMTILYLNPDRVFKLYAQQRRRTSTAKERNIPESTLKFYLQRSDEYLGTKSTPFKVPTRNLNPDPDNHSYGSELFGQPALRKQTRAWVFDYKRLKENYDISLEINLMTEEGAE